MIKIKEKKKNYVPAFLHSLTGNQEKETRKCDRLPFPPGLRPSHQSWTQYYKDRLDHGVRMNGELVFLRGPSPYLRASLRTL